MAELLDWVKNSDVHMLVCSCVFHYEFELIHPFAEGNGRVGRLWHTLLLSQWDPVFAWLPMESMIHDRQQEYYAANRILAELAAEGKLDNKKQNMFMPDRPLA